ncbi:MAG: hypothetical protein SGJ27_21215 [Candidatus Melainabacteria bacterium]|nr:hypothetical protein [Candidatus Melainabacteria bacterium]
MPRVFIELQSGKIQRLRTRSGGNKQRPQRQPERRTRNLVEPFLDFDALELSGDGYLDDGHKSSDCSDACHDYDFDFDFLDESDLEASLSGCPAFDSHDEPAPITKLSMSEFYPDHDSIRCLTRKLGFVAKAAPAALLARPVAYIQSFYGDDDGEE